MAKGKSVKYCVFWYPTIFHQEPQFKREDFGCKSETRDISDKSKYPYYIKIRYKKGDLFVYLSTINDEIRLKKEGSSNNGFVKYSYDLSAYPFKFAKDFERILVTEVYHLAKTLFHEHEVDNGADSSLQAFLCYKNVDISQENHLPLFYYLNQFHKSFHIYSHKISDLNRTYNKLLEKFEKLENQKFFSKREKSNQVNLTFFKKIIHFFLITRYINIKVICRNKDKFLSDHLISMNELCENAIIEYTYCKTLLESKYNGFFRHNIKLDDSKDKYRKRALNIRNSIRYIECIKFKSQNWNNYTLRSTTRKLKNSGIYSLLLAILSILLGLISVIASWGNIELLYKSIVKYFSDF